MVLTLNATLMLYLFLGCFLIISVQTRWCSKSQRCILCAIKHLELGSKTVLYCEIQLTDKCYNFSSSFIKCKQISAFTIKICIHIIYHKSDFKPIHHCFILSLCMFSLLVQTLPRDLFLPGRSWWDHSCYYLTCIYMSSLSTMWCIKLKKKHCGEKNTHTQKKPSHAKK